MHPSAPGYIAQGNQGCYSLLTFPSPLFLASPSLSSRGLLSFFPFATLPALLVSFSILI